MHSRAYQSHVGVQVRFEDSLKPLVLGSTQTIPAEVLVVMKSYVQQDDVHLEALARVHDVVLVQAPLGVGPPLGVLGLPDEI
jgi:hypothetical protein